MLTKNNIPESQKDTKWCEDRVKEIIELGSGSATSKTQDVVCWNLFNELQDDTSMDYLRKYGNYEIPAKARHIGIQRPKINYLRSIQARRNFVFSVYLSDNASIEGGSKDIKSSKSSKSKSIKSSTKGGAWNTNTVKIIWDTLLYYMNFTSIGGPLPIITDLLDDTYSVALHSKKTSILESGSAALGADGSNIRSMTYK